MIISFDNRLKDSSKRELTRAAYFFVNQLLTRDESRGVSLEIATLYDLDDSSKGSCLCLDDGPFPKEFRIEIQKGKVSEVLSTLAHEIVHLKQYVKGELRETSNFNKSRWHGKLMPCTDQNNSYFDHPWEIEAYGREVGLMHKYNTRYKKKHVTGKRI